MKPRPLLLILTALLTWMGAAAQPAVESQLSYRRFTTQDGLPQMQAETVWQDARGYIYIGTLSGFVRYDGREFTPFLKGQRQNVVAFTETSEGVSALGFRYQWFVDGTKTQTRQLDAERHWLLNNLNTADLPTGYILLEDDEERNRRLCTMTTSGPKGVLKSALFDRMTPDRKLFIEEPRTSAPPHPRTPTSRTSVPPHPRTPEIYIPTSEGLYVISDHQARRLTMKGDIYTMVRAGDDLLVLAADGIYRLTSNKLEQVLSYRFEAPDYGLSARLGRDGTLYIADSHTLYAYDGHSICRVATGFNMIKGLFVDRWGRLWLPTYQGVYLFFNAEFTNHRLTDQNDIVRAIGTTRDHIFMGTLNGKLIVDRETIDDTADNFYAPSAVTIGDTVYMADRNGVVAVSRCEVRGARYEVRRVALPDDSYRFVAKADGRLIAGSRRQLMVYDPQNGRSDTLTTEIPQAWCAADDAEGRIWVGSSRGLFCVEKGATKSDYPDRPIITAMERDMHGNVLFAAADSLLLIRHGDIEDLTRQLPLLKSHEIRSLHVSPQGYLVVGTIDGMIVAHMETKGERYKITEARWFDHTNGFTMLEPLMATMAETDDGTVWMAGIESMTSFNPERLLAFDPEVTIVHGDRPWWQRWWVWLIVAVVMGAFIWALAYQYEKRRSRLAMQHLQREKKLKELQISAIRLKTIPHFHSNVLASIDYMLNNDMHDEAGRYLKLYSNFTNQTLSDIDRPARTIAEETDYARTYLELEQMRLEGRMTYSIQVADNVDRQTLIPTMLLHTYCQNAVKHGIVNKPEGGHIDVTIAHDRGAVVILVKDNGVGRAKAATLNQNSTKQGLKILMQQIEIYNQTNRHPITQSVRDLYDDKGEPAGTCFRMCIPDDYEFEEEKGERIKE